LQANTYAYGRAFEHFIITEAIRRNHYLRRDYKVMYLRTKNGAEVDRVVERPGAATLLVEIKSSASVDERSIRTLRRFFTDTPDASAICLLRDPVPKKIDAVSLGFVLELRCRANCRAEVRRLRPEFAESTALRQSLVPWQQGLDEIGLGF